MRAVIVAGRSRPAQSGLPAAISYVRYPAKAIEQVIVEKERVGLDNPSNSAITCKDRSELAEIVDGNGRDREIEGIADLVDR